MKSKDRLNKKVTRKMLQKQSSIQSVSSVVHASILVVGLIFLNQSIAKDVHFNYSVLKKFSSWGIDPAYSKVNIDLSNVKTKLEAKRDVIVAVVDTGIDPTHSLLSDNIVTKEGKIGLQNFGKNFAKSAIQKNAPTDQHGHGTHVAGIIKSVFQNVKLLALKYYDPNASGQDNLSSTIKALKYAVDQNVDIINYSGGGPEASKEELAVLKEAERKGILVVAAAGNEKSNIDLSSNAYYPASYRLSNIITVTAHDENGNSLSSSNYGPSTVDISAPGNKIKSSIPNNRAGLMTGTSQATAFVSGIAALLKSTYPSLSAVQIKNIIKTSAKISSKLAGKCYSHMVNKIQKSCGIVSASNALKISYSVANNLKNKVVDKRPRIPANNKNIQKVKNKSSSKRLFEILD